MYDTDPNRSLAPRIGEPVDSPYAGYAAAGLFIAMIVLLTMAIWPSDTSGPTLTHNSPQVGRPSDIAAEAKSVLRSLIRTIKVTPGAKRGEVYLELHGELAAILAASRGKRTKDETPVSRIQVSVVAGTRNCHYLLFNATGLPLARLGSGHAMASQ